MKWQGANSFRTSHYPYSEEMMRLCDEEGIVVIDETTAVGVNLQFGGGANFHGKKISTFDPEYGVQTQEHHKEVVRDLIARDKNHACVVMWSIANEPDSAAEAHTNILPRCMNWRGNAIRRNGRVPLSAYSLQTDRRRTARRSSPM